MSCHNRYNQSIHALHWLARQTPDTLRSLILWLWFCNTYYSIYVECHLILYSESTGRLPWSILSNSLFIILIVSTNKTVFLSHIEPLLPVLYLGTWILLNKHIICWIVVSNFGLRIPKGMTICKEHLYQNAKLLQTAKLLYKHYYYESYITTIDVIN